MTKKSSITTCCRGVTETFVFLAMKALASVNPIICVFEVTKPLEAETKTMKHNETMNRLRNAVLPDLGRAPWTCQAVRAKDPGYECQQPVVTWVADRDR